MFDLKSQIKCVFLFYELLMQKYTSQSQEVWFYRLLKRCWHQNPEERPVFEEIITVLEVILESQRRKLDVELCHTCAILWVSTISRHTCARAFVCIRYFCLWYIYIWYDLIKEHMYFANFLNYSSCKHCLMYEMYPKSMLSQVVLSPPEVGHSFDDCSLEAWFFVSASRFFLHF